ncbi:hypothetical protein Ciccas_012009 [Cichlidogyrus casuarinus]|uniref:Uncharacterized protein n=1 Tax=Cichlidogyrus casuarinus TaxID=1844966 RepID=A0ABD2PQI5_9PLAT
MTKIQPEVGHKIDFSSSTAQKKALNQNINRPSVVTGKRSRPQNRKIPPATVEELDQLMGKYFSKHSSVLNNP